MKRNILFAFGLLLLLSCFVIAQTPSNSADQRGYLLGPGDKIQVKVLGEEQFNFQTEIDPNGKFFVPFVEDKPVEASCRTENELRAEVAKRYAKYLKNPMVSFAVTERRKPSPVTIYGEIMQPQRIELAKQATLMELIAFSGGVKEDSAGGTVQVVRTQLPICASEDEKADWEVTSNSGTIAPSRMYTLSSATKGIKEANPRIYPGDIIFVDKASPVYINGEVVQPRGVYIKEKGLSLNQAISMVGGPRDRAQLKDVKIYRLKPNSQQRKVISINLKEIREGKREDIMLEPYDIIDIEKKKKSVGQVVLETITGAAVRGAGAVVTQGATRIYY